jgi:hypothetical protein
MRQIIGVVVYSILISFAIKPSLDTLVEMSRAAGEAETRRYVEEELPGVIYNDVSIFFPAKVGDAAIDSL